MFVRVLRVFFRDETSKRMVISFTDSEFDHVRFEKFGCIQKFWIDVSTNLALMILIFKSEAHFNSYKKNLADDFINSIQSNGNKVEISDGKLIDLSIAEGIETIFESNGKIY